MSRHIDAAQVLGSLVGASLRDLAEAVSRKTGQSPILVALDLELVDGSTMASHLAQTLGLARFDPHTHHVDLAALCVLEPDFLREHSCFPVSFDAGYLLLAMVDPLDLEAVELVEEIAGYPVRALVATLDDLDAALAQRELHARQMGPLAPLGTPALAIPTAVFLGYPDGVGVTSLIWNLACLVGRRHPVLLVSIGGPREYAGTVQPIARLGASLAVVPDAAQVPDLLADVWERAETGSGPRFDLALAEIGRPASVVNAHQLARWARTLFLVTDPEHAGLSWDLIARMYRGVSPQGVSVGIVMNRVRTPELAEVGMAALDAAVRASGLGGSVTVWAACTLPYDPDAFLRAETRGDLLVEASPRHPVARELKELARRLLAKTANGG